MATHTHKGKKLAKAAKSKRTAEDSSGLQRENWQFSGYVPGDGHFKSVQRWIYAWAKYQPEARTFLGRLADGLLLTEAPVEDYSEIVQVKKNPRSIEQLHHELNNPLKPGLKKTDVEKAVLAAEKSRRETKEHPFIGQALYNGKFANANSCFRALQTFFKSDVVINSTVKVWIEVLQPVRELIRKFAESPRWQTTKARLNFISKVLCGTNNKGAQGLVWAVVRSYEINHSDRRRHIMELNPGAGIKAVIVAAGVKLDEAGSGETVWETANKQRVRGKRRGRMSLPVTTAFLGF